MVNIRHCGRDSPMGIGADEAIVVVAVTREGLIELIMTWVDTGRLTVRERKNDIIRSANIFID